MSARTETTTTSETGTSPEVGRTVDAGGIPTNVHVIGDPATAPTVLLLHGSGPGVTAYANWRLTMPALARQFAVVAPDIVGFGYTARPDGFAFTMENWTRHVTDLLDTLGIDRVHVIGNSFGGALALSLAIHAPQRVNRLVLMGAAGVPFDITPGLEAVWGYEPSVEAMRDLLRIFAHDDWPINDDLAELRYRASIRPGVQEAFSAMFPAPRQVSLERITHDVADIARIENETLIVHGRDDRVIPMQNALDLLRLIDRSQAHIFGRCGHWTQIEHADAFNDLVVRFLSRE